VDEVIVEGSHAASSPGGRAGSEVALQISLLGGESVEFCPAEGSTPFGVDRPERVDLEIALFGDVQGGVDLEIALFDDVQGGVDLEIALFDDVQGGVDLLLATMRGVFGEVDPWKTSPGRVWRRSTPVGRGRVAPGGRTTHGRRSFDDRGRAGGCAGLDGGASGARSMLRRRNEAETEGA
jgi:hypothetical protein